MRAPLNSLWLVPAAVLAASLAFAQTGIQFMQELAPTGKLRVAIAVAPSPSALFTIKDEATSQYRGVTVALGTALAKKLGVPLELVPYPSSGEIVNAANSGAWDVSFMPVDDERKKIVDFGSPYHLLQSTYLVAPASGIRSLAEVNTPGVRITGVANTATFRASNRASPNATHVAAPSVDAAVTMMKAGQADAIALSRESLTGLLAKIPDARILDGGFLNSTTAVCVPKGRPAALAYVSAFIEDAKASGLVRAALDGMGLEASAVAPPGMRP
jgi:polar amino acid transport system substrate-binding protein